MSRHAYLIIAHRVDYTLKTLLTLIDDSRNDIFLHMDKKNRSFSDRDLDGLVSKGNLYILKKRIAVGWGTFEMVKCEMVLLEEATKKGHYEYYHYLSGADLPLKNQDYIHEYFDAHRGMEFVGYGTDADEFQYRVQCYHFFMSVVGRGLCREGIKGKITAWYHKALNRQKRRNFQRYKGRYFYKGSQWVSVTDKLARDLVAHKKEIYSTYRFTSCTDEMFIQTFVREHDEYYQHIWQLNKLGASDEGARYIDWERGNPYVWKTEDYDLLRNSKRLFARKFDCDNDANIIDLVSEMVNNQK